MYDSDGLVRYFRQCDNPGIAKFKRNMRLTGVGAVLKPDTCYPNQTDHLFLTHAKFCCGLHVRRKI